MPDNIWKNILLFYESATENNRLYFYLGKGEKVW